ncbi:MAG: lipid A deacylase LpxR family protein [Bacteroidota bacterium]
MRYGLFILFGLFSFPAFASLADSAGKERIRFISLDYQNDYFNATDYYFTQGVRLDAVAPVVGRSPFRLVLPKAGKKAQDVHGLLISQECFTPTRITSDTILTGDRPFAACIFIGQQRISSNAAAKYRLISEVTFGFLGSRAGCMETQQTIHGWIDGIDPRGWQHQVSDAVIVNYHFRYEKPVLMKKSLELIPFFGLRAGTLYDHAEAGINLRTGRMNAYFDQYRRGTKKIMIYAELTGQVRTVAYNATLQGGLFSGYNPYVIPGADIERLLLRGGGRLVLRFPGIALIYSRTWTSPEFRAGRRHGWGGITVVADF